MSEEYTWKALLSLLLALISAPTAFVIITFWLLTSNTVLELWLRLSAVAGQGITMKFDVASEVFYKFVKYIGILFFVLTSATAASKFGPALAWIEFAIYSGVGVWLFTMIGRNASKLMGSSEFSSVIRDIIKRLKGTSEK